MSYKANIPTIDVLGGSVYPYVLAARLLNNALKYKKCLHVEQVDPQQAVFMACWQSVDGSLNILAANLEEGLRFDAESDRYIKVVLPDNLKKITHAREVFKPSANLTIIDGKMNVQLRQAESKLIKVEGVK